MKRYTRGFTLIELLVVIAIIGILASVVLVSLQSARKKGQDSRVISSVQQLRIAIESEYNGNSYANAFTSSASATAYSFKGVAPYSILLADVVAQGFSVAVYGTTASPILPSATAGLIVVTDGVPNGSGGWTGTGEPKAYAIRGKLPSTSTLPITAKSFCIDSTGKTNQSEAVPAVNYAITCS